MRRLSINSLKPGMQLSLLIRDGNGNILLNRNIEWTSRYIQRLVDLGFQSVYIADPEQDVSILPSTDYKLGLSEKLDDTTDFFGRKRFFGTIINREKNRIDFIKVSFTLRDREGVILETVETYISGQRHRYRDRQVSTSSLSPGRTGTFDFISSIDAIDVFSYTYTISGVQFIYPL